MPPAERWWAAYRTAGGAAFLLDNDTAMPGQGQRFAETFPYSQEAFYVKQPWHCSGS